MFKENGREKPADSKETAHLKGKVFECLECGYTEVKKNVEFGEVHLCPKCKSRLAEQVSA